MRIYSGIGWLARPLRWTYLFDKESARKFRQSHFWPCNKSLPVPCVQSCARTRRILGRMPGSATARTVPEESRRWSRGKGCVVWLRFECMCVSDIVLQCIECGFNRMHASAPNDNAHMAFNWNAWQCTVFQLNSWQCITLQPVHGISRESTTVHHIKTQGVSKECMAVHHIAVYACRFNGMHGNASHYNAWRACWGRWTCVGCGREDALHIIGHGISKFVFVEAVAVKAENVTIWFQATWIVSMGSENAVGVCCEYFLFSPMMQQKFKFE